MLSYLTTLASANNCTGGTFFGLEPWWHYLPQTDFTNCSITTFNVIQSSQIPLILLAVIDDLLRIAGLVAVGFVFYGAFKYIGSQGSPEGTAQAQSTIINALIGLAVASMAIVLVNFLGRQI